MSSSPRTNSQGPNPGPRSSVQEIPRNIKQEVEVERERKRRLSWSRLLAWVFAIDVLDCPRCHSRMQPVEWATRPGRIKGLLDATGLPVDG